MRDLRARFFDAQLFAEIHFEDVGGLPRFGEWLRGNDSTHAEFDFGEFVPGDCLHKDSFLD